MRTVVEVVGVSACLIAFVAWIFGDHHCHTCGRTFDTRRELDDHIARHPN